MNTKISITLILAALLFTGCSAKTPKQISFSSPEGAAQKLMSALAEDNATELARIFGPGSEELLASGDPVSDRSSRKMFVALASETYRVEESDTDTATLLLGAGDWPFPIPLVRDQDGWVFDTAEGKEEIIDRRIGRNEIETMDTLEAIVDAQREYFARKPMGIAEYAQRLGSSPQKRDGLFWARKPGEQPSPLGPLVVEAVEAGYTSREQTAQAFNGYRFRILKEQGTHAKGGKRSYLDAKNRLTKGFGLVAYPAVWGVSGIMTFITSADGAIFERDLGPESVKVAEAMTAFDPADGWKRVDLGQLDSSPSKVATTK